MCFDWFLSIQPIRGQTHRWRHRQQILFLYYIEKNILCLRGSVQLEITDKEPEMIKEHGNENGKRTYDTHKLFS